MISKIKITKLFGLYDYELDFNYKSDCGVTILTGPNGYGKTTILKMIDNLYKQKFLEFYLLSFSSIVINYVNAFVETKSSVAITKELEVSQNDDDVNAEVVKQITFQYYFADRLVDEFSITKSLVEELSLDNRSMYYRGLMLDDTDSIENVIRSESIAENSRLMSMGKNLRMFLQEESSYFVPAQRIFNNSFNENFDKTSEMDSVISYLKEKYTSKMTDYAKLSQEIDGRFVQDLVNNDDIEILEEPKYKEESSLIRQLAAEYQRVGLSSSIDMSEEYPDEYRKALSLNIKNSKDKLETLKDFYTNLSTFLSCIRRKNLSDKYIYADPNKGLYCILGGRKEIPLTSLSSGERNIIVLYFSLIFRDINDKVILIDEPENSMHPAWLNTMMDDMLEMARNKNIQIIIATHSPSFIGNYWNLTKDLYGINIE